MITDDQLNEIIDAPRPVLSTGYGANSNLYKHYIQGKFYRSMDKTRMLELCGIMLKRDKELSRRERDRVEEVMNEIKKK